MGGGAVACVVADCDGATAGDWDAVAGCEAIEVAAVDDLASEREVELVERFLSDDDSDGELDKF